MKSDQEVKLALRGVLESIAELPDARSWNSSGIDSTPPANDFSIDESYVPQPGRLLTATAANGVVASIGLYLVGVNAPANVGSEPVHAITDAILGRFPPGSAMTLDSGDVLRIEGGTTPSAGQILRVSPTRVRCLVSIPWLVYSRNAAILSLTA